MATNKKGFLLYADQQGHFENLPDEYAGKLIKLIYSYVNDEDPEIDDLVLKVAFEPIKQSLKRDLENWAKVREAKSKGGKASAKKRAKQKSTKVKSLEESSTDLTVSVNDSVSVIVNDNVIENIEGVSEEFRIKWMEWIEYKKVQHNFEYKTRQSEEAAMRKLKSMGEESTQIKIIDEAMAHGWKGFHKLKEVKYESTYEALKNWGSLGNQ